MKKGLFFFSLVLALLLMAPLLLSSRIIYGGETTIEQRLGEHLSVPKAGSKCWAPLSGTGLQHALAMASHRQINNRFNSKDRPAADFEHTKALRPSHLNTSLPQKLLPAPVVLPQ